MSDLGFGPIASGPIAGDPPATTLSLSATLGAITLTSTASLVIPPAVQSGGGALPWWYNQYIQQQLDEKFKRDREPRIARAVIRAPMPIVSGQAEVVPVRGGLIALFLPKIIGRASRGNTAKGKARLSVWLDGSASRVVVGRASGKITAGVSGLAYLTVDGKAAGRIAAVHAKASAEHLISGSGRGSAGASTGCSSRRSRFRYAVVSETLLLVRRARNPVSRSPRVPCVTDGSGDRG